MNQYMHEAYECLVTKLKGTIKELTNKMDERYCADNTAISMLLDMHAQEERHNYFLFISNIIKESAWPR